jgi:predicted acylesterase/phospholipase RssA/CRP-like cAMP-binding protein
MPGWEPSRWSAERRRAIIRAVDPSEAVPAAEALVFVREHELFRGAPEAVLSDVASSLSLRTLQGGELLFEQGEPSVDIYLVEAGDLRLTVRLRHSAEVFEGVIRDGVRSVGETHAFTGGPRVGTVRAEDGARLYRLANEVVRRSADAFPELARRIGEVTRSRMRTVRLFIALSKLLPGLDEETLQVIERQLTWVYLQPGERLFAQGEPSDAAYIVIAGHLYAVLEGEGAPRVLNTLPPGELIGEIGMFTGEPHTASVYASRDSELIGAARPVFEALTQRYPAVMRFVVDTLIGRLKRKDRAPVGVSTRYSMRRVGAAPRLTGMRKETRTVAVVPIGDLDAAASVGKLASALEPWGKTLALDAARVDALLGIPGGAQMSFDRPHTIYLTSALDQIEAAHRFVLYVADRADTGWTRWCLRRADRILLLASAAAPPDPDEIEEQTLGGRPFVSPPQTLVLLHEGASPRPSGTRRWLELRDVDDHLHVALGSPSPFASLARSLVGRSVGVVLSGGGARGLAHIGVLRALAEARIPIDLVGGTSIGAVLGAMLASGRTIDEVHALSRVIWVDSKPFRNLALPIAAILGEGKTNDLYRLPYGDMLIEDLPVGFFCISSNLTKGGVVVHRDGPVWNAVRASSALPGIMVPVAHARNLLVDGAMLNNLPADVMRELGPGMTILVNVSASDRREVPDLPVYPSPLQLLFRRKAAAGYPTIVEILTRSALLASMSGEEAARAAADLYLQPPVQSFALLDFASVDRIAEAGYAYAKELLARVEKRPWEP